MEKRTRQVVIDGVVYTLDSDNKALLQKMPEINKYDPVTKKYIKVQYEYIPIGIIKTLLGGLTDGYDIIDYGATYTGEEYETTKTYNNETKTQELRQYEYKIEYHIEIEGKIRKLQGYCRGVANKDILCSDSACNGFFQKLSARATKAALKNFAKIFRMDDEADDVIAGTESYVAPTPVEEKPYEPKETTKKKSTTSKPTDDGAKTPVAKEPTSVADKVMQEIDKTEAIKEKAPKATQTTPVSEDVVTSMTDQDKIKKIENTFVDLLESEATKEQGLAAAKALKNELGLTDPNDPIYKELQTSYKDFTNALKGTI